MTTTTSRMTPFDFRSLVRSKDAAMALGVILIIALRIVPLPAGIVDLLVVINLGLSIAIMLLTMYIARPMDFSVFPTVLLLVTLFRLGLNISASRLILLQGDQYIWYPGGRRQLCGRRGCIPDADDHSICGD